MKQQFKVSSVLFSCSKFFFFPKENYSINLFLLPVAVKLNNMYFFLISYSFKKKKKRESLQHSANSNPICWLILCRFFQRSGAKEAGWWSVGEEEIKKEQDPEK